MELFSDRNDIIEILKKEHNEVESVFNEIEKSDRHQIATRARLYSEVKELLGSHAHAEEAVLYKAMLDVKDLRKKSYEGSQEHAVVDGLFKKLDEIDPEQTDLWEGTIKVLKEAFLHHKKEEEDNVFPAVKKNFDEENRKRLGSEFFSVKSQLLRGTQKPHSLAEEASQSA